jgi:hypothetical protein
MLMVSCGTGIEVTEHVSDKEVKRVITRYEQQRPKATLETFIDSVPAWVEGKKRFWVADSQVRLLLSGLDDRTIDLSGHTLVYKGYNVGSIYDNRETVNLLFEEENDTSCTCVYRTGKTIDEFNSGFTIPMLIDMDLVSHIARQVVGNDYYINTAIWYDPETEQMINGRHYIMVHVDSVLPGNAVMPLRVLFTTVDTRQQAMVWMSDDNKAMLGRDFDALFTVNDPRQQYPLISDNNWKLITCGQVVEGMTKEECRLAMGSPKSINQRPDQGGMREYWYYDGGAFLYFVDGLLNQFRR